MSNLDNSLKYNNSTVTGMGFKYAGYVYYGRFNINSLIHAGIFMVVT